MQVEHAVDDQVRPVVPTSAPRTSEHPIEVAAANVV